MSHLLCVFLFILSVELRCAKSHNLAFICYSNDSSPDCQNEDTCVKIISTGNSSNNSLQVNCSSCGNLTFATCVNSSDAENSTSFKCTCKSDANSHIIISVIFGILIIVIACILLCTFIVLRRRRKALNSSKRYNLISKLPTTRRTKMTEADDEVASISVRQRMSEGYEFVEPIKIVHPCLAVKPSTDTHYEYIKYIEKDQPSTAQYDESVNNFTKDQSSPEAPTHEHPINRNNADTPITAQVDGGAEFHAQEFGSSGYLSRLLTRHSEKIRRTRTTKNWRKPGYALRKAASQWDTDKVDKEDEMKSKSEENITKSYYELQQRVDDHSSDQINDQQEELL